MLFRYTHQPSIRQEALAKKEWISMKVRFGFNVTVAASPDVGAVSTPTMLAIGARTLDDGLKRSFDTT